MGEREGEGRERAIISLKQRGFVFNDSNARNISYRIFRYKNKKFHSQRAGEFQLNSYKRKTGVKSNQNNPPPRNSTDRESTIVEFRRRRQ